jgi:ubiquinone/menaquinone biosynthesis C-methylase UbiE
MNTSDVKTFFETTAAKWDTMRLAYYDEAVIETIADAIAINHAQNVLDVGTGTGFIAAGLAPRVGRVIAIDNSPAMLNVARGNLAQLQIGNVELRRGDLTRLPLDDDSVDAAVANMVLHHAEDPAGMVTEMARVVRPGGRVAITDAIEHRYDWMRTEQADIWLGFTPT